MIPAVPQVPDEWLSSYLSASCAVLPSLSSQQLTMCLWGLATAACQPDKAWLMLWFLESKANLQKATTQVLLAAAGAVHCVSCHHRG